LIECKVYDIHMGIHSFVSGGENVALIAIQILGISVLAGLVGAVLGLGGGIIVTPALTLLFGVDIKHAIGASIISVIATSSGSAIAYIRDRIAGQLVHLVRRRASSEAFEGGHFPNFCTVSGYCFEGGTPAPVVCNVFADCPPRIHAGCSFRLQGADSAYSGRAYTFAFSAAGSACALCTRHRQAAAPGGAPTGVEWRGRHGAREAAPALRGPKGFGVGPAGRAQAVRCCPKFHPAALQ